MPALAADDDDFFDDAGGALVGLGLGGADLVGGVDDVVVVECLAIRSALRTACMHTMRTSNVTITYIQKDQKILQCWPSFFIKMTLYHMITYTQCTSTYRCSLSLSLSLSLSPNLTSGISSSLTAAALVFSSTLTFFTAGFDSVFTLATGGVAVVGGAGAGAGAGAALPAPVRLFN